MASLLSRLAPIVITLRGSKRMFSSAQRTLDRVAALEKKPVSFQPPKSLAAVRTEFAGWPVYTISPASGSAYRTVVYLHGGCYVFEIDPVHWSLIGKLANEAGVRVVVPIMPLAPTGTASSVVPIVAALVQSLDGDVSIVGDSSGGGMALAVAMELRDREARPLHHLVLISPWLDISGTDPRLAEIAPSDPWLAVPGTHAAGGLYRDELGEGDWRVSPIHGSLEGLGPVTMFSGTRDILNADAHRFVPLAADADLALDFHEGPGMIHNYAILPMPEGDAARAVIVAAVR